MLSGRCCLKEDTILVRMLRAYDEKQWLLAKIVTEQMMTWLLCIMALIAVCSKTVIEYPFTRAGEKDLVRCVFAMIIAKYIFCITSDVMLQKQLNSVRFKVSIIHSIVTLVCYSVFLAYEENVLLGLVGAMMEVNNTTVEILRTLKEIGCVKKSYRNISLLNCVLTLTFRGVVPIVFLVIAMFHEKPFKMSYGPLTTFFLSIIFFSVISVWLVLSSIRRSMKLVLLKKDDAGIGNSGDIRLSDHFRRNNLGYLPRFDNINISNISEDSKMNYNNRKDFAKIGIDTACAQLNNVAANQSSTTVVTNNQQTENDSRSELSSSERSIETGFVTNSRLSEGSHSSYRSDSSSIVLLDNHSINSDNENSQQLTMRTLIGNEYNNMSPSFTGRQNTNNTRNSVISISVQTPRSNCENL
ncbi:hypothetical protein ScPMuIL_000527 [Solemya velum]